MGYKDKRIAVAGSSTLDLTPMMPDRGVYKIDEYLKPGTSVIVEGLDINPGGAVSNTGLAISIFGGNVDLYTKVGDDQFGHMLIDIYKSIDPHAADHIIISDESASSYTVVLAIPGIDRLFIHDSGMNHFLGYDDFDFESLANAHHFHFGYPSVMRKLYQNGGKELIDVLKKVKSLGLSTSVDTTSIDPASEPGKEDWRQFLITLIPHVDIFTPSVEELCWQLHPERYDEWAVRADGRDICSVLDLENDIMPLVDEVMELGAKVLMLKCGTLGMIYRTASKEALAEIGKRAELNISAWADQSGYEPCFKPSKIVSATGAGDVSIAGFLLEMLDGGTPADCAKIATAAGACCIEGLDARAGLMTFEEIKARINSGWEKA